MKIRCPACGKGIEIDDRDAASAALCLACGHRFKVDAPPTLAAVVPAAAPLDLTPPPPAIAETVEAPEAPTTKHRWAPAMGAVAAAAMLIGGLAWLVTRPNSPKEIAHHPTSQAVPSTQTTVVQPPSTTQSVAIETPAAEPFTQPTTESIALAPPEQAEPIAEPPATVPSPATQSTVIAVAPPTSAPTTKPRRSNIPPLQPQPEPPPLVSDEEIGAAIQRGVEWLLHEFDLRAMQLRNSNDRQSDPAFFCGLDALAVYALLQSGQAVNDPRLSIRGDLMPKLLERLKHLSTEPGHPVVYARGIRATALALYGRTEDRGILKADLAYLLRSSNEGAYTYRGPDARGRRTMQGPWDNSNTQYGLLGVWSAVEAGEEVPTSYWLDAQKHWAECQSVNGQWAYHKGGETGTLSMTAAGMASLFVAEEYLDRSRYGARVGRPPFSDQLDRALRWFESGDNAVHVPGGWWGYTLYGIERVGLASGFKYFGKNDWYSLLARQCLDRQQPNGSWTEIIDTCYQLLFLARGRHPILMNKLRAGSFWANRPRDAANLARYVGKQLERPLNWQVVPLDRPWNDWLDSPILYLASHRAVPLKDEDYVNLQNYVEAGGLLFTHADEGAGAFSDFAETLARKLFPKYELRDLPASHPIYSILYKIEPRPTLKAVMNGSRVLMLHSSSDLARNWQLRNEAVQKNAFQLGANLFVYVAGKREFRNRIASNYVSDPGQPAAGEIDVARLTYAGNDDPEPGAWRRYARWFQRQTGTALRVKPTSWKDLRIEAAPFAHLTGTARYEATDAEVAALRNYVEAGGFVLIDAVGGSADFARSAREALARAFPSTSLAPIASNDPLLQSDLPGMTDLAKPRLRQYAVETLGGSAGRLESLTSGRGRVVFTEVDLTSGLLHFSQWEILGYQPDYAQRLLERLLLELRAPDAAR